MRFSVLASGSGGNACYVETARARVLVDAGLSCRETIRRLEVLGVDPASLDALVITHEHTDHISGAGPLARRFHLPVYMNGPTLRKGLRALGAVASPVPIQTGQTVAVNDLFIETFTKCHDAADPMGLVLCSEGARLGIITDLGRSTPVVEDRLRGCRALIVEFNHDEKMLEDGPYPLELKRRIRGDHGHLSNRQAAHLVSALAHPDLEWVIPAHLSEINNEPARALQAVRDALEGRNGCRSEVVISSQDSAAPMLDLWGCTLNARGRVTGQTKGRRKAYRCSCCGQGQAFCWTCPCGFQICNECMEENLWGLTCSGVNWQCPDCGALRPY